MKIKTWFNTIPLECDKCGFVNEVLVRFDPDGYSDKGLTLHFRIFVGPYECEICGHNNDHAEV